jgi:Ca2+-binding RTX toxin-like protein
MTIIDLTASDDVYDTTATGDVINGLAGNDQLSTNVSNSTLNGDDGDDVLVSNYSSVDGELVIGNTLNGGRGSDSITACYGSTVDGEAGNDTITIASVELFKTTAHGGAGDDFFRVLGDANSNFASIYGDDGDDQIVASGEGYLVDGGNGADYIDVFVYGLALSEIFGGNENDMIQVRYGVSRGAFVDGGNGNDTICLSQSMNLIINGGAGDDNIFTGTDFTVDRTTAYQECIHSVS